MHRSTHMYTYIINAVLQYSKTLSPQPWRDVHAGLSMSHCPRSSFLLEDQVLTIISISQFFYELQYTSLPTETLSGDVCRSTVAGLFDIPSSIPGIWISMSRPFIWCWFIEGEVNEQQQLVLHVCWWITHVHVHMCMYCSCIFPKSIWKEWKSPTKFPISIPNTSNHHYK